MVHVIPGKDLPQSPHNFIWEIPKISGYFIGGPHNKDYRSLGSICWVPLSPETPNPKPQEILCNLIGCSTMKFEHDL